MTVEADSQSVLLTGDGTHSEELQRTDAQGVKEETFSLFTLNIRLTFIKLLFKVKDFMFSSVGFLVLHQLLMVTDTFAEFL